MVKQKHENYKEYVKYIGSYEWKLKRLALFKERGKQCERCGGANMLHVHHKTYERLFNELPQDLEILCKICHLKEHGKIPKSKKEKKEKKAITGKYTLEQKAALLKKKQTKTFERWLLHQEPGSVKILGKKW